MERDQNGTKPKVRKEPVLDYLVEETVAEWERFLLTRHMWTCNSYMYSVHQTDAIQNTHLIQGRLEGLSNGPSFLGQVMSGSRQVGQGLCRHTRSMYKHPIPNLYTCRWLV